MVGLGSGFEDLLDIIIGALELLILDIIIPILQSFVPGSSNSIWEVSQYPLIMLIIVTLGIYIIARR